MTPNELSEKIKDWEYVKDKIFFALEPSSRVEEVKTKTNNDEYVTVPMGSKQICLIYKIKIDEPVEGIPVTPDEGIMSSPVKASMLTHWEGINAEDLFDLAIKNRETLFPAKVDKLPNFLNQLAPGACAEPSPVDNMMLVVTSFLNTCGAATIFLPGVDDSIKELLNCEEYWLIPSSTHELLAIPATDNLDVRDLEQIVKDVNTTLDPKDILGEEVLYYDAAKQSLEPAKERIRAERDNEKGR